MHWVCTAECHHALGVYRGVPLGDVCVYSELLKQ